MTETTSDGRTVGGTLLDAIPDAAFVLTPALEIAAVNGTFGDLLGADRTTFVNTRLSRVLPDRAVTAVETRFSADDPPPLETRVGTPAGDTVPVVIHFSHVSPSILGVDPPVVVGGGGSSTAAVEIDDPPWLLGTLRALADRSVLSSPPRTRRDDPNREGDAPAPRSIGWTVDGQGAHPDAERVLKVLHDPRCRRILGAVGGPPMPAKEIADVCDLPRSTTYRKLNLLREADLVDERIEFEGCGRHATTYVRNFARIAIAVTDGGDFRLEIHPRA